MKNKSRTQEILEEGIKRYERLHRLAQIVERHPEWISVEPEIEELKIAELLMRSPKAS